MTQDANAPSRRGLMQGAALIAAMTPAIADASTPNRGALQRVYLALR